MGHWGSGYRSTISLEVSASITSISLLPFLRDVNPILEPSGDDVHVAEGDITFQRGLGVHVMGHDRRSGAAGDSEGGGPVVWLAVGHQYVLTRRVPTNRPHIPVQLVAGARQARVHQCQAGGKDSTLCAFVFVLQRASRPQQRFLYEKLVVEGAVGLLLAADVLDESRKAADVPGPVLQDHGGHPRRKAAPSLGKAEP